MLTHSPAAAEGSRYYEEGYYHEDGRAPAEWFGNGAEALGLRGAVSDREKFDWGLDGLLPDGTRLPDPPGDKERRHGDDWTFSPPKSVTLVALVGGDERVVQAHDRAVREAVRFLEREMFGTRGMVDGEQRHLPGGAVVGIFRHETGRPVDGIADPQLHTHTVWLNAALREDGEWRAVDWDLAGGARYLANSVYLGELAADLRRSGYDLVPTRDAYEIQGIPREAIRQFGRRAALIESELAKIGRTRKDATAPQRQAANLRTREGKGALAKEVQQRAWERRARGLGLDLPGAVAGARSVADRRAWDYEADRGSSAARAVASAVSHLSERSAVFSRRELAVQALKFGAVRGVVLPDLDRGVRGCEVLADTHDGRFTTHETLAGERSLLEVVREGRVSHAPLMSGREVAEFLEDLRLRPMQAPLTQGQETAIRLALTGRDLVMVIEGYAGAGKTAALDKLREGIERVGGHVQGLAPSSAAAKELERQAHVPSQTLDAWLASDRVGAGAAVLIVDEAGMVSTRKMAELVERAYGEGSRVILVGDRRQLHAVEAGNPLAAIVRDGAPTAVIGEILRQRDPDLKAVVEAFALGNAERGVEWVTERFVSSETVARPAALDYLARSPDLRARTIILSGTNAMREAINQEVRSGLKEQGLLGEETEARTLRRRDLTREELRRAGSYAAGEVVVPQRDHGGQGVSSPLRRGEEYRVIEVKEQMVRLEARHGGERIDWEPAKVSGVRVYYEERTPLAEGDRVIFRENSRELGVVNGDRGTIVRASEQEFGVRLDRGGRELTLGTEQGARLEHAYATTVHAAQGQTVDHVVIAGETGRLASAEQAYVSFSRARESAVVYTDAPGRLREAWSEWREKENALGHVEGRGMGDMFAGGTRAAGVAGTKEPRQLSEKRIGMDGEHGMGLGGPGGTGERA